MRRINIHVIAAIAYILFVSTVSGILIYKDILMAESIEGKPEAIFKLPDDVEEVVSITQNKNGNWVVGYRTNVVSPYRLYKAIQYGPGNQTFTFNFVK